MKKETVKMKSRTSSENSAEKIVRCYNLRRKSNSIKDMFENSDNLEDIMIEIAPSRRQEQVSSPIPNPVPSPNEVCRVEKNLCKIKGFDRQKSMKDFFLRMKI